MNKKHLVALIVLIIIAGVVAWLAASKSSRNTDVLVINQPTPSQEQEKPTVAMESFADCMLAGEIVLESYPRQCRNSSGQVFVEDIVAELEKSDLIRLDYPRTNSMTSSPLAIAGEARGTWYFEASFPVTLVNWDGLIIAESFATAQDDWMTEDFVPFKAALEFDSPVFPGADAAHFSRRGALILRKDNPSDLPEYDDYLEIPVWFE